MIKITTPLFLGGRRRTTIGQGIFTEFGELASVENQESWVTLTNTENQTIMMKKVYSGWADILQKAQSLIGSDIIYETGSSANADTFFRSIYEDNPLYPLFDVPKDAGPNAINLIFIARLSSERTMYRLKQYMSQNETLREALENTTKKKEDKTLTSAIQTLDKEWDDWIKNPYRSVMVAGQCINKGEFPDKIDISFATRLGINTTKIKRLNVKVHERYAGTNKIVCELLNYDNQYCTLALKQSDVQSTLNEWAVATVENNLTDWFKIENSKKYKNLKQKRKDISYFLGQHDEMMSVWVENVLGV